jgi:hypothetical protein
MPRNKVVESIITSKEEVVLITEFYRESHIDWDKPKTNPTKEKIQKKRRYGKPVANVFAINQERIDYQGYCAAKKQCLCLHGVEKES